MLCLLVFKENSICVHSVVSSVGNNNKGQKTFPVLNYLELISSTQENIHRLHINNCI